MSKTYNLASWQLSDLLPDIDEQTIQTYLDELETKVATFETYRDTLSPEMSPQVLLDIVARVDDLTEQIYRASAYSSLWFSADTQSNDAITFRTRMQQVMTDVQNRTLFFDLWWIALENEEAEALLPSKFEEMADTEDPHLSARYADYRHYLLDLRRTKPYTLDEKSEQIINTKNANGVNAVVTLYTMLTNRLEFTLEIEGEEKKLTRSDLSAYYFSPDLTLRAAAYQELYRVYGNEANILAQIYVNRVRDWYNENVGLRHYDSPISVRNVYNDIPDSAIETLLDVCRQNVSLFQRYFKLKAQWLDVKKLRRYDLYAPLNESDRIIEYSDAVETVLDTFEQFDPQVAQKAARVFQDQHIDSEVRKGKRGGAFCLTALPSQTPWVMLNYTGKVRDVATLAHELGHAIHSMMAEEHSILTQHAALPLAETASVFAEILLTDRMLATETDPLARRELLAASIDDMYATVMRQAYFVIFEKAAHKAIQENKSAEDLHELYLETLREQFGDSLDLTSDYRYEWVSIPHIYNTPFYCYAYSFGQLLVLSLYRRYQQEGEAFKPGYLKMLAYGGSTRPEQILNEANIDITDAAFWQGGFDVIRQMIDEVETIEV